MDKEARSHKMQNVNMSGISQMYKTHDLRIPAMHEANTALLVKMMGSDFLETFAIPEYHSTTLD